MENVRGFERAGAAMVQIEDQGFPKRCGHLDGKTVVPVAEMCGKLKAALDARQSVSTLILARTDAVAVEGLDAALERAEAYLACGVDALFIEAVRSPVGKRNGGLSGVHPADLSAQVLNALVERAGVDPALVDDVIWGCVMQAGEQALDIGRTALLTAGWPESVPGVTVDRQCGSSQQSVHFAAAGVVANSRRPEVIASSRCTGYSAGRPVAAFRLGSAAL